MPIYLTGAIADALGVMVEFCVGRSTACDSAAARLIGVYYNSTQLMRHQRPENA